MGRDGVVCHPLAVAFAHQQGEIAVLDGRGFVEFNHGGSVVQLRILHNFHLGGGIRFDILFAHGIGEALSYHQRGVFSLFCGVLGGLLHPVVGHSVCVVVAHFAGLFFVAVAPRQEERQCEKAQYKGKMFFHSGKKKRPKEVSFKLIW